MKSPSSSFSGIEKGTTGTLPGWNKKVQNTTSKLQFVINFIRSLKKNSMVKWFVKTQVGWNVNLTMPTALLRWDPDLQSGSWSSSDPPRGSVLQARVQHKMSYSLNHLIKCWKWAFYLILTLNWKCWRAAGRLCRLMFCILFWILRLFWQNCEHYCSTILADRETQQNGKNQTLNS